MIKHISLFIFCIFLFPKNIFAEDILSLEDNFFPEGITVSKNDQTLASKHLVSCSDLYTFISWEVPNGNQVKGNIYLGNLGMGSIYAINY